MSENPQIETAMARVLNALLAAVYAARPGEVKAYDATARTATIAPLLREVVETPDDVITKDPALLQNVPVFFPGGGGYATTYPLAPGDQVLLIFCDAAIDQWWDSGALSDPIDLRKHDANDAIALAGLVPSGNAAHAENMVLGDKDGVSIHIKPNGEIHIGQETAAKFIARADRVEAQLQVVYDALTMAATGTTDGGALYKTNIKAILDAASFPQSPACDKVKGV